MTRGEYPASKSNWWDKETNPKVQVLHLLRCSTRTHTVGNHLQHCHKTRKPCLDDMGSSSYMRNRQSTPAAKIKTLNMFTNNYSILFNTQSRLLLWFMIQKINSVLCHWHPAGVSTKCTVNLERGSLPHFGFSAQNQLCTRFLGKEQSKIWKKTSKNYLKLQHYIFTLNRIQLWRILHVHAWSSQVAKERPP